MNGYTLYNWHLPDFFLSPRPRLVTSERAPTPSPTNKPVMYSQFFKIPKTTLSLETRILSKCKETKTKEFNEFFLCIIKSSLLSLIHLYESLISPPKLATLLILEEGTFLSLAVSLNCKTKKIRLFK